MADNQYDIKLSRDDVHRICNMLNGDANRLEEMSDQSETPNAGHISVLREEVKRDRELVARLLKAISKKAAA